MGKCDENCKHLELCKDEIKGHETTETGGYCLKHKKMVYFGESAKTMKKKATTKYSEIFERKVGLGGYGPPVLNQRSNTRGQAGGYGILRCATRGRNSKAVVR